MKINNEKNSSGGKPLIWGQIRGDINLQSDLQQSLLLKANQSNLDAVYTDLSNQITNKQSTLVSGTNIKTVNGNNILGIGDIAIGGMPTGELGKMLYYDGTNFVNTPFFVEGAGQIVYPDLLDNSNFLLEVGRTGSGSADSMGVSISSKNKCLSVYKANGEASFDNNKAVNVTLLNDTVANTGVQIKSFANDSTLLKLINDSGTSTTDLMQVYQGGSKVFSIDNVGKINSTSGLKLDIASKGTGKILTSDADGVGTWQLPATTTSHAVTYPVTLANCENTTTETTIASFTIPANTWGDGEKIEFLHHALYKNNSGGTTNFTKTLKIGTTSLLTGINSALATGSAEYTPKTNIILQRSGGDVLIYSNSVLTSEAFAASPRANLTNTDSVTATATNICTDGGAMDFDFTTDITLNLTITHSVANANIYYRSTAYNVARKI